MIALLTTLVGAAISIGVQLSYDYKAFKKQDRQQQINTILNALTEAYNKASLKGTDALNRLDTALMSSSVTRSSPLVDQVRLRYRNRLNAARKELKSDLDNLSSSQAKYEADAANVNVENDEQFSKATDQNNAQKKEVEQNANKVEQDFSKVEQLL